MFDIAINKLEVGEIYVYCGDHHRAEFNPTWARDFFIDSPFVGTYRSLGQPRPYSVEGNSDILIYLGKERSDYYSHDEYVDRKGVTHETELFYKFLHRSIIIYANRFSAGMRFGRAAS